MKAMRLSAILLAAGESSRMGRPKALLPWFGGTLVEFQVEQLLAGGAAEVLVILGHEADKITPFLVGLRETRTVLNPDYPTGKCSSICAGVAALSHEADGILILGVDQPRPAALVRRLRDAHARGDALITIPAYKNRRGHPPIFARQLFPEIAAITEEKRGLREVIGRHRDRTQTVEADSDIPLLDLNSPEDYQKALDLFAAFATAT